MKVGFLFYGFSRSGGIESIVKNFTDLLSENKDNNICTIAFTKLNSDNFYGENKKVKEYCLYEEPTTMAKALIFKGAIKKLKEIVIKENFDYLIACGALYYILAIKSTKKTKTQCICWEHTHPSVKRGHKAQMLSRKYAVKNADRIIVLTKNSKDYYINKLNANPLKIIQIYNFINDNAFQSIQYCEESQRILSVGRLVYPKNYEILVDIAEKVLTNFPDWSWDIYGAGPEKDKISKKIKEKKLDGRLNLKGEVKNILSLYKDYSFFVMTSRYEGFPMVLLEAAANKLPMLSFNIPGPDEIIDEKNGFLIENENVNKFAFKIIEIIKDKELRKILSKNSFETATKFNGKNILKEWEKLFIR